LFGIALDGKERAAPRNRDVERRFDLAQIDIERAAQPREALVVDGLECELKRL
jgi:hypothetical protein